MPIFPRGGEDQVAAKNRSLVARGDPSAWIPSSLGSTFSGTVLLPTLRPTSSGTVIPSLLGSIFSGSIILVVPQVRINIRAARHTPNNDSLEKTRNSKYWGRKPHAQ